MGSTIRIRLKKTFDRIVYQHAWINKILRNLNKQLSGVTSFRLRPYGTMQVRLKSGVKFNMATNETSSVTKLLFWKGADEYEYTRIFEPLVSQCKCFLDIGANTGYYALLAAHVNPAIKVYAFEPASAPFHYLQENIRINALRHLSALPVALSDKAGELTFFELANPGHYHSQYNLAGTGTINGEDVLNQSYNTRKVPADTLDSFLRDNSIAIVDLVKIDTEGSEHVILAGAREMLATQRPIIICETLFQVIEHELETIMKPYGYQFFNYKDGWLVKTERLVREHDDGVRDCFFVHPDKLAMVRRWIRA